MKKFIVIMVIGCLADVSSFAQTPLYLSDNYYSKRMVKVFAAAKENKLEKAEDYWKDMEEKAAKDKKLPQGEKISALLSPVWQLSECVIMNTREGREKGKVITSFDPWKAYDLLSSATRNQQEDVRCADLFLSNKDIGMSVASIKIKIEENLIKATSDIGTETAYDRLINTLYDYTGIYKIEQAREEVAFREVIKTTQVKECVRYLEKYKGIDRTHLLQMESRRDSLAFVQMGTTAKACKQYLTDYPQSQYKVDVTKLLHKYEFNEMAHTEAACEQYLKQYPFSEYASKVKELKVAYAFEEAKAKNSLTAYRTFLNKYGESVYADEAVRLTEDALMKRYFNSGVTIGDLEKYVSGQDRIRKVDDSRILALYTNLQTMTTSASMMECKGLVGTVTLSTIDDRVDSLMATDVRTESEETLVFNPQGLLERHRHSRSGRRDEYQYDFDTRNGFRLVSKTDNKGNVTKYTTTFDANGLLAELSSSKGEKLVYSFNDKQLNKITHYNKSGVVKTDYYGSHLQLEKSVRNGVTIVYKYNSEGDVASMSKMKGNTVMESTTYEYEYSPEGLWTKMAQYNNGYYFLTKTRQYEIPTYTRNGDNDTPPKVGNTLSSNADVFDVVEQMPSFPGGDVALMQFLSANVHYPEVAEKNEIQGRVIISFVVERNGTITDVEVVKSVDPLLDKEAIRVIRSMPQWKPGTLNGKPVRVKYTTPVTFRLQ